MATATATGQRTQQAATREDKGDFERLLEKSVRYTPFAESEPIELKYGQVHRFISPRTKSGAAPSESDIVRFMMLCQARALNPWVGDAYLIGYDSKNGPTFSLVTSIQALLKRAEANPLFDGMQQGVIVRLKDGTIKEREGDLYLPGETLVGGWARLYRKDRSIPFYDALNLSVYSKGNEQWGRDPAGMVVKCAQASVLRTAFPSQLSGLYIDHEMAREAYQRATPSASVVSPRTLERLVETRGPVESATAATSAAGETRQATAEPVQEERQQEPESPADEQSHVEPERQAANGDTAGHWQAFVDLLKQCTSEADARGLYDVTFGPDSQIGWTGEQDLAASRMVADHIAAIPKISKPTKGGK